MDQLVIFVMRMLGCESFPRAVREAIKPALAAEIARDIAVTGFSCDGFKIAELHRLVLVSFDTSPDYSNFYKVFSKHGNVFGTRGSGKTTLYTAKLDHLNV